MTPLAGVLIYAAAHVVMVAVAVWQITCKGHQSPPPTRRRKP